MLISHPIIPCLTCCGDLLLVENSGYIVENSGTKSLTQNRMWFHSNCIRNITYTWLILFGTVQVLESQNTLITLVFRFIEDTTSISKCGLCILSLPKTLINQNMTVQLPCFSDLSSNGNSSIRSFFVTLCLNNLSLTTVYLYYPIFFKALIFMNIWRFRLT